MTCRNSAMSPALRVSGPQWSMVKVFGKTPRRLTRPYESGGDRRAGAARRAARQISRVPRVAGRWPRQVPARPAEGEFPGRELAHQHRAARFQQRHEMRVVGRDIVLAEL